MGTVRDTHLRAGNLVGVLDSLARAISDFSLGVLNFRWVSSISRARDFRWVSSISSFPVGVLDFALDFAQWVSSISCFRWVSSISYSVGVLDFSRFLGWVSSISDTRWVSSISAISRDFSGGCPRFLGWVSSISRGWVSSISSISRGCPRFLGRAYSVPLAGDSPVTLADDWATPALLATGRQTDFYAGVITGGGLPAPHRPAPAKPCGRVEALPKKWHHVHSAGHSTGRVTGRLHAFRVY